MNLFSHDFPSQRPKPPLASLVNESIKWLFQLATKDNHVCSILDAICWSPLNGSPRIQTLVEPNVNVFRALYSVSQPTFPKLAGAERGPRRAGQGVWVGRFNPSTHPVQNPALFGGFATKMESIPKNDSLIRQCHWATGNMRKGNQRLVT